MMFDFNGVEEAQGGSGGGLTRPGTIGVFTIEGVTLEYTKNTNKPVLKVKLNENDSERYFTESFFIVGSDADKQKKLLSRIQALYAKATGTELTQQFQTAEQIQLALNAALANKQVALKVTGSINRDNGKAYPELPFGGFAKEPANIGELAFTSNEETNNAACLEAIERENEAYRAQNSNGQAQPAAANVSDDDAF